MSSLFDTISSVVTLMMSAAFLHFGATGQTEAPRKAPTVQMHASQSASSDTSANQAIPAGGGAHAPVMIRRASPNRS